MSNCRFYFRSVETSALCCNSMLLRAFGHDTFWRRARVLPIAPAGGPAGRQPRRHQLQVQLPLGCDACPSASFPSLLHPAPTMLLLLHSSSSSNQPPPRALWTVAAPSLARTAMAATGECSATHGRGTRSAEGQLRVSALAAPVGGPLCSPRVGEESTPRRGEVKVALLHKRIDPWWPALLLWC
jgi:hypothetical protein